jgi:hypothetical protein
LCTGSGACFLQAVDRWRGAARDRWPSA